MINLNEIAENILNISKQYGCNAQISMKQSESKDISLRNGEIERLLTSVAVSTGIRLFKGKKSTLISFSGEDFNDMEHRIKIALQNADYLNDDNYRRLLNPDEFAGEETSLDLNDNHYDHIDIPQIKEALKRIESRALAFSNKITPSDTADFSGSRSAFYLFSSEGLRKHYNKSFYSFGYTAVAQENGLKERDSWSENKRHFSQLPALSDIGRIGEIAAEKAAKRLGGKKIKSGEYRVIFPWRTADNLLDLIGDAIDGEAIVAKNSFLVDKVGEKIFPDRITIIDDPLIPKYIGSYPFDGEGMNGKTKPLIADGRLVTYLHNSYSAGKLHASLTGNASHAIASAPHITVGNFYLQGGQGTLEDLITEMKDGLMIEELYISGINDVTGDFSFGCTGFLIENSRITTPVKEITIAGNLLELYRNITHVADDNPWRSSVSSPSILVSHLTVAGS
ncbi:MAG: TldD/PmbA family protein [Candidatus Omnitrophota bacterium]